MRFYSIEATLSENITNREEFCPMSAEKSEYIFQQSNYNDFAAFVDIRRKKATFAVATRGDASAEELLNKYLKLTELKIDIHKIEEITTVMFINLMYRADRFDTIVSFDEVLNYLYIAPLRNKSYFFGETMIDTTRTYDDIVNVARNYLYIDTMIPEIERIYKGTKNEKIMAHPVHYLIQSDDTSVRKLIYKNLLSALYYNGRIKNRRYAFVDIDPHSAVQEETLDALYMASEGGAVVIRFTTSDEPDSAFLGRNKDVCAKIGKLCRKFKNRVQTIVCMERSSNKLKGELFLNSGNTSFVELHANFVCDDLAQAYLKSKAQRNHIRADKKLTDSIMRNKMYNSEELDFKFDEWFCAKVREKVYPQYKNFKSSINVYKENKVVSESYNELHNMIGLTKVKEVIDQALNYFKLCSIFADRGISTERPSMHMIFTGNPGTAKTTVARLFAEIMKERGLLTSGNFIEVGRADIVGKYVGSTAPLVKSVFKEAKGGVLFIDEAYSLVDDKDGLYGDEAINTIVQEMENNREDTIVIFAGYPDKMEGFLNKNPGLRSRIAFHIPFDDYNPDELCEIAELIASEQHLNIDNSAKSKLRDVFAKACVNTDFGNGRYARNVVEKAKFAQASRLMSMDYKSITDENIATLCAEDFDFPEERKDNPIIRIGFSA